MRRVRPSPAMVVAAVSLFISISGVAWAAGIAANSVRSKQIKDEAIKEQDLGPGSVTTVKLADGSITTGKILGDAVTSAQVDDGSLTGADLAGETLTGANVLDGGLTDSDIENESLTGTDIDDDSLTGADVQDNSLGGGDIDESSLVGFTRASGSECCGIERDFLDLGTAFNPSNADTLIRLGSEFELRTAAVADADVIQLCKLSGTTFATRAYAYLSGVRQVITYPDNSPAHLHPTRLRRRRLEHRDRRLRDPPHARSTPHLG